MAILRCTSCGTKPHSQDELHGEGMRVHNRKMNGQYACTVCGNVRGEAKVEKEEKKKKK